MTLLSVVKSPLAVGAAEPDGAVVPPADGHVGQPVFAPVVGGDITVGLGMPDVPNDG